MTIFGAGHVTRALSLFQANSRAEGGAFIRSLQTSCLGKKAEERIKANFYRVEEGRGRKCNRYSHFTRCSVSESRP